MCLPESRKNSFFLTMTIYLRVLPLSLERDETILWRINDLWWSFPFAWNFPCSASLAAWAVHKLLVSKIAPFLSHPLVMPSFCFLMFYTLLDLPLHSLFHAAFLLPSLCKVIGVRHMPFFISDLNSSRDLPRLNWEFPIGVSLTKYPVSNTAYYRLKNQPRHHVNLI
jgi:hypothetical protein